MKEYFSMKSKKVFILIAPVLLILLFVLIFLQKNVPTKEEINYAIKDCNILPNYEDSITYDKSNKIVEAYVLINCCGVDLSVEKRGKSYFIYERQHGTLCRCVCMQRIIIFDVESDSKIIFISKDGKRKILSPNLNFCGISTYSECYSDNECVTSGCSNQVCQFKYETPIITPCEFKECYNANKFQVSCKCIDNKCQWG